MAKKLKGKTWEDIHGAEKAEIMRNNLRKKFTGIKRPEVSIRQKGENNVSKRLEVRQKISESNKGKSSWMKGLTKKDPRVLKVTKKGVKTRKKNNSYKINSGSVKKSNVISIKTRKKMSKSRIGKKHTEKSKRKMRLSMIRYLEKQYNDGFPMIPAIGKNETLILNMIEEIYKYKIKRQYHIKPLGYFVDGYIEELNLVIEIDEWRHFDFNGKLKEKDLKRQKEIEKELNCKFLRIKDSFLEENKIR